MKHPSGLEFASAAGPAAARIRQRKQPVQSRSRATVEAILEATLQVLLAAGYARLTTTRVAERAGVSVGTLYQYFPDKLSLVTALKARYAERIVDRVAGAARAAAGLPLEPAMRAVISAALSVKCENLELTLALRDPALGAAGEEIIRDALRRLEREVRRVLEAALPGLRDPGLAAWIVVAAVEGAIGVALQRYPSLLRRPGLEEELTALAVGYLRER